MNIKLDEGAFMPIKAHETDAGYDILTPVDVTLYPKKSYCIKTGVHWEIPKGYVGMLKAKSGLNCKYNIVGEGVIDSGYTGEIMVKLYNHGDKLYKFKKGEKIIQMVVLPYFSEELTKVDSLESTERGNNGFGSTGK